MVTPAKDGFHGFLQDNNVKGEFRFFFRWSNKRQRVNGREKLLEVLDEKVRATEAVIN